MDILTTVSTRNTPVSDKAKPTQVKNSAGGYVFQLGDEARLQRFLTLGSEGGTYYTSAKDLTKDNAQVVFRMAAHDPIALVNTIKAVSTAGRAPKQQPAIFALAIAASCEDDAGRRAALAAIPDVCRTASTLFTFVKYVEQFRGWGRGLRDGVGRWFEKRDTKQLAYQMVKYRQREGWTHRDVLRMSHPDGFTAEQNAMVRWAVGKDVELELLPPLINDYLDAQTASTVRQWVDIIGRGNGISWEMLPDAAMNQKDVWAALLSQGVPQTALMRQLGRLTNLGLTTDSAFGPLIAAQLQDAEALKRGRVHPINVLVALKTYQQGRGEKGSTTWSPTSKIVDALDAAFYAAFGGVEPSGKRMLVALDVSGSMESWNISGMPLTPRVASGALAMVQAATESNVDFVGFTSGGSYYGSRRSYGTDGLSVLDISARRRMDDVIRYISGMPFGGTDCSLPARWAKAQGKVYDGIVLYTDNETWAGSHPFQALETYRNHVGLPVRQVVVGMTATGFSIADPADTNSLDVAGFDSAIPNLITDFVAGRV